MLDRIAHRNEELHSTLLTRSVVKCKCKRNFVPDWIQRALYSSRSRELLNSERDLRGETRPPPLRGPHKTEIRVSRF
jgi:hypothetical protein